MGVGVAREVVLDPDRVEHPSIADELRELLAPVGPVESGGDEHRDVAGGDAVVDEGADHRPEKHVVRYRAGDVAYEDAGGAPAPGQACQRRRAGRLGERPFDRARGVADDRQGALAEHRGFASVRDAHRKPPATVFELHEHHRLRAIIAVSRRTCRFPPDIGASPAGVVPAGSSTAPGVESPRRHRLTISPMRLRLDPVGGVAGDMRGGARCPARDRAGPRRPNADIPDRVRAGTEDGGRC